MATMKALYNHALNHSAWFRRALFALVCAAFVGIALLFWTVFWFAGWLAYHLSKALVFQIL